jgi:hypothetical protein
MDLRPTPKFGDKAFQLVSLIVSHGDTEVFQAFLDAMAQAVPANGKEVWLILDNASWHKSKSLDWHHIKVKFLPSYSSDSNPIERLWPRLKRQYLAGFITRHGCSQLLFASPLAENFCPDIDSM